MFFWGAGAPAGAPPHAPLASGFVSALCCQCLAVAYSDRPASATAEASSAAV